MDDTHEEVPVEVRDNESSDEEKPHLPEKSDKFWFEDGNIVLVTGDTAFRVHRGILAKSSAVFKDLFELSQPTDGDTIEGCPTIPLSDTPTDVSGLLDALYHGVKYIRRDSYPSWDVVRGMVLLGRKYQIDDLRDLGIDHLKRIFPTDIAGWDAVCRGTFSSCMSFSREDYIGIATLAREIDLPLVRTHALYKCCLLSNSVLVNGHERPDGSMEKLSPEDLQLVLAARHRLTISDVKLVDSMFGTLPPPCATQIVCVGAVLQLQAELRSNIDDWLSFNPLNPWEDTVARDCATKKICPACTLHLQTKFTAQRQHVLDNLTNYFR